MKLTPKPERDPIVLKTWKDLDDLLQFHFKKGDPTPSKFLINPQDYEMSKEEIIESGAEAGYKVSENNNHLLFE